MRRALLPFLLLVTIRCSAPAPDPMPSPEPAPVAAAPAPATSLGTVRVNASALNVRREASTDGAVIVQLKRGEALTLIEEGESWSKVRLANGEIGYVSSRFISRDGGQARTTGTATKAKPRTTRKGGCPPDSDYAFVETPTLTFSDSSAHGLVIVEATVSARGDVQSTKVVTNNTGDPALAFLAEREIRKAKFSPPIRNCVARSFIFTYRRTF
ncbi:MAG TPA: SH3 domain-containing protein [Thermoanaerobaculia bacterium]